MMKFILSGALVILVLGTAGGSSKTNRPIVYVDKELDFVEESAAPGISDFRSSLSGLLGSDPPQKLLHEDIIYKLSEASEQFSILIIKTDFAIPYTSVFFQLDCKYWDAESELKLRKEMESLL